MDSDTDAIVKVGSGENWHQLVMHCLILDLGGLENLSLIPGTVGAAPMQNIGAYGVEIKDVFHQLEALNLETLAIETFDLKDCQFGSVKVFLNMLPKENTLSLLLVLN